nr:TetR/AcrR family transcriptional regulator [Chelativorans alearense]
MTRTKLLRAACQLMSTKGIDETTIDEITNTADVGFGTFYNYFSSKDEIATRVLDCVIHTLGRRNDLANRSAGVTDPVFIIANSVRLVAREMMTNPMWRWWLKRTDLMVQRMRAGFKAFGIRDMKVAIEAGAYEITDGDLETAWSFVIWLLAGSITDIVEGYRPASTERLMAEAVMRVMGVNQDLARRVSAAPLPPYPEMEIDFDFELIET